MNYDFEARHYDPRIGRWAGVDLLAETYENVSPYNYVANSPINNIDANGMDFSPGIPCPKWGEPGGGLFSAGANVLASFAAGLLGSLGNGPVAIDKADAPGQQASLQSRSNITSSLNGNGTTVQEGGGDPGGKKKTNANQGRPSSSSLQANYPGDNYTSTQVYKLVGGNIYQRYQDDPVAYANSCALRLSYALNKAGAPIPKLSGTAKGGDGMNYFFRVKDLGNYMNATYGAPDINGKSRSLYSGEQGIIEFNVSGWSDATGHFTIWVGNSVGHGDYFSPTPPAHLTNAHLWIFP